MNYLRDLLIHLLLCGLALPVMAEQGQVFKIGVTLPLTGEFAGIGDNIQKSIELALAENPEGPSVAGRKLQFIYEDIGAIDVRKAATAVSKLVNIDQVDLLLSTFTEDSEVVYPVAKRHKLIDIAIYGGSPALAGKSPTLFQVSPNDALLIEKSVEYAVAKGLKKPVYLVGMSAYTAGLLDPARQAWKSKAGIEPQIYEFNPGEATDFKALLSKAQKFGCDLLIMLDMHQGIILKQVHELQMQVAVMGMYSHMDETLKDAPAALTDGLIFPRYRSPDPDFISKFKARFQQEPNDPADYTYDIIGLLLKVFKESGFTSKEIEAGLLAQKDFRGATGIINFEKSGMRSSQEVDLWIFKNGQQFKLQ